MNICMMTNTYKPFVGGVEASVEIFTEEFRKRGHRVLVVTPTFEGMPRDEVDVFRFPAIQHFNGSDFSVKLPVPGILSHTLDRFKPDIIHTHHPFLMGDTALRIAANYALPLIFTFHTFFERYTHYAPGDSPALKRFVTSLASGYANLCDHVIAPSDSVAGELLKRGVQTAIDTIPTGIYTERFAKGDGHAARAHLGIPEDAFLAGFVSRLAPEKNIDFLCNAVVDFLRRNTDAWFLVIGKGPSQKAMAEKFEARGVGDRIRFAGTLQGKDLIDGYHAMDVFTFASHTETQGLVVAESMAAGVPVVAVNASGIREIVRDKMNGALLARDDTELFSNALSWYKGLEAFKRREMIRAAKETAAEYAVERSVEKVLTVYRKTPARRRNGHEQRTFLEDTMRRIQAEWELLRNTAKATEAAIVKKNPGTPRA